MLVTAAALVMTSALATAPAQAGTVCNSGRLCLIRPGGETVNVVADSVPGCSTDGGRVFWGYEKLRNRSNRAFTVYHAGAELSRLDPGETISYNTEAVYTMCRWGF
ncbi:hypothetical protein [Streptomyces wuyuanensis]|uniref:Peptidase inhibitor family I36 n=1 Tax=Streptomyces wuyuanensis TaxID=1196353 RepID=A0A1H0B602_9ACTN|nr:hypothetical protein [Streptomyces wuyuanensis]SDN41087.1 hypothetical protein SAMN05444921_12674 [Streptomyces wuyuanensis]